MIGAFAGVVHHICGSCSACITPPKQLKLLISLKKWRGSCSACITFLLHNVFHKICTALSTVRSAGVLHQICSGASPVRRELFIKWRELFITRLRPKNDVGGSSSSHAGSSSSHPNSSTYVPIGCGNPMQAMGLPEGCPLRLRSKTWDMRRWRLRPSTSRLRSVGG